jgi:hypothetical protein
MATKKRTIAKTRRPAAGARRRLPTARIREAICSWINDQFEGMSPPTQLANPPTIADCAVWTCVPNSGLVGVTYLAGRIVYYSSSNGVNNTAWWRIGSVPRSVMP